MKSVVKEGIEAAGTPHRDKYFRAEETREEMIDVANLGKVCQVLQVDDPLGESAWTAIRTAMMDLVLIKVS